MGERMSEYMPVILAILTHAAASIWWASKMNNTMINISTTINRLDKELEKRDVSIKAIGEKLDNIRERVIILEHNGNNGKVN